MTREGINRRGLGLGAGALLAGGLIVRQDARAGTPDPVPPAAADRLGRMTMAVRLNGRGPYRFALDSAASLSMIAEDLVLPLGLAPDDDVQLHTLLASERARTVRLDRLQCGALDVADARMAVGSRIGMAGLDGLISAAALGDERVTMSFRHDRMAIGRSRGRGQSMFSDEHRIPFRSPAGRGFENLVVVKVRVGGRQVDAIIDTGAHSSIANTALLAAVGGVPVVLPDGSRTRPVQSVTGQSAEARLMIMRALHFGPVSIDRLPVLVADFHTFDVWGLGDRPALLLGVDVLSAFESVAIDFNTRQLVFHA